MYYASNYFDFCVFVGFWSEDFCRQDCKADIYITHILTDVKAFYFRVFVGCFILAQFCGESHVMHS